VNAPNDDDGVFLQKAEVEPIGKLREENATYIAIQHGVGSWMLGRGLHGPVDRVQEYVPESEPPALVPVERFLDVAFGRWPDEELHRD